MSIDHRDVLLRMFAAAVDAASPAMCVPSHLPEPPAGRTVVVGAGKAAAAMAAAVEAHWNAPLTGCVVTRYGHGVPCRRIKVVEAGHPVPDQAGCVAAREILEMVSGLGPDDLVLGLFSGGGSSLLALPARPIALSDKQALNRALLKSGATIQEINTVRKHLSAIKGGRLAATAMPARVVSLIISDVPRDDLSSVASGPTVPDPTTRQDALAVLENHSIMPSSDVVAYLADLSSETPKPGDARFHNVSNILVATPQISLEAAAKAAGNAGFVPFILGNAIEGKASEVGLVHAGIALQCADHGQPFRAPCALISGGETTVTVRGTGRGGRNTEFLLSLCIALGGHPDIAALAADTDGLDGTEDNAGAVITLDTLKRAAAAGLDVRALLSNNDSYMVFAALGDLVSTGPTRTNVNDFRAVLVSERALT